jgi:hypothetical protein
MPWVLPLPSHKRTYPGGRFPMGCDDMPRSKLPQPLLAIASIFSPAFITTQENAKAHLIDKLPATAHRIRVVCLRTRSHSAKYAFNTREPPRLRTRAERTGRHSATECPSFSTLISDVRSFWWRFPRSEAFSSVRNRMLTEFPATVSA